MHIMAPEPISTAYFKIPPISLCVCICILPIVARQRLGKHKYTTEELLDTCVCGSPIVAR
jgi:hypothetical protein